MFSICRELIKNWQLTEPIKVYYLNEMNAEIQLLHKETHSEHGNNVNSPAEIGHILMSSNV